jgi:hypothetical protein
VTAFCLVALLVLIVGALLLSALGRLLEREGDEEEDDWRGV